MERLIVLPFTDYLKRYENLEICDDMKMYRLEVKRLKI